MLSKKNRRQSTRRITVGGVPIGDGAPIAVQSMTNTDTRDVRATVNQILRLTEAGCEIARLAVRRLVEKMEQTEHKEILSLVPGEIIHRGSCAAPVALATHQPG